MSNISPSHRPMSHQSVDTSGVTATRTVVAVVLERHGQIALFRRSQKLDHDRGLWHCITGFVELDTSPEQQAAQELFEETGLALADLLSLHQGPLLELTDHLGDLWQIHTFTAEASTLLLTINWEHDAYRWISPSDVPRMICRVSWLERVLEATGHRRD